MTRLWRTPSGFNAPKGGNAVLTLLSEAQEKEILLPRFNAPKGGNAVLTQVYRSFMAAANDCFNAPKGGNAVLTVQEEVTPTSTPVIVSMPRRAVMLF